MRSGILATSVIGCLATTSSPCISILYWSSVMAIASSADLGHRKEPLSSLLYMRRKPSPSHKSALILLFFLPQNKKVYFYHKGQVQTESGATGEKLKKIYLPKVRVRF